MTSDVIALLDHLKLDRVHVMGWSDGGITALFLAIMHPERINRLVVLGTNFTTDGATEESKMSLEQLTAKACGVEDKQFFNSLRTMWLTQSNISLTDLRSIIAPTLVAAGDHDAIRLEHTIELFRTIPKAQLLVIPGASHTPDARPRNGITKFRKFSYYPCVAPPFIL